MNATERFSGRANAYHRFREHYDGEIVLRPLRKWCGLIPEWTIADIGAGTGMLADVFLANGNRVIAIEPNADMREACVALHQDTPNLQVLDGSAEHSGLDTASVDLVSVGRALHWFDFGPSVAEFQRILKPGGWITAVAFGRLDEERAENIAYEQLLRSASSQRTTREPYQVYKKFAEYFSNGKFHQQQVDGIMSLNWESLQGLTLSISYAPRESDPAYQKFEEQLHLFYKRFEHAGQVKLATRYWIDAGRLGSS